MRRLDQVCLHPVADVNLDHALEGQTCWIEGRAAVMEYASHPGC